MEINIRVITIIIIVVITFGCSNNINTGLILENGVEITNDELSVLKSLEPMVEEAYRISLDNVRSRALSSGETIDISNQEIEAFANEMTRILVDAFGDEWTKFVIRKVQTVNDSFYVPADEDFDFVDRNSRATGLQGTTKIIGFIPGWEDDLIVYEYVEGWQWPWNTYNIAGTWTKAQSPGEESESYKVEGISATISDVATNPALTTTYIGAAKAEKSGRALKGWFPPMMRCQTRHSVTSEFITDGPTYSSATYSWYW